MKKAKLTRVILMASISLFVSELQAESQNCGIQKTGYYRFSAKQSLKDNISSLTAKGGWQLVWKYPADLPVLANSAFKGILFCSGGVLDQVIASIKETGSFGTIGILFDARNKVVLISNNARHLHKREG